MRFAKLFSDIVCNEHFLKEIDLEAGQTLSVAEISLESSSGNMIALIADIKQLSLSPTIT